MLTCKKASQLISQSLDRPLTLLERLQLVLHLCICDACRRFKQQLNQLRAYMQKLLQLVESDHTIQLSTDAKARVLQQINRENASDPHESS